jgi:hypothetical protein
MIVYVEREEIGGITEASRFASSLQVLELVDTLSVYIFEGNYALVSAFHISPPILYTNRQASEHGAILICSWTSGLRLFSSYFGFFAVRLVVYCAVLTWFHGRSFVQRR